MVVYSNIQCFTTKHTVVFLLQKKDLEDLYFSTLFDFRDIIFIKKIISW